MNQRDTPPGGFLPAVVGRPWPVVALLACHFLLGITAAKGKSVTFDEITHLSSGLTYWATGDYRMDPESGDWPQRWVALPIWLEDYHLPSLDNPAWRTMNQWSFAELLFFHSGNDADAMLLQGRAMVGLLSIALGALVYFWARQLFGPIGGLISLTLYAFSPTMLSHGFLTTADLMTAFFFSASMWSLWALLQRISGFTLAVSSFALAGLLLSKFSGVLIMPMGLLLLAMRLLNPNPVQWVIGRPREIKGRLKQLAVFCGVILVQIFVVAVLIWISYGCRYRMFSPSMETSQIKLGLWADVLPTRLGITRPFVYFAREHHLLPEGYLYGFTYTMCTAQSREAFLNGDFGLHGWVSFFPYALLVKTPLEVFLILGLAVAGLWCWRRAPLALASKSAVSRPRNALLYSLSPILVLLFVYWVFSLTSHLNIGHRHLLPTYPPMLVLAGAAGLWFRSAAKLPDQKAPGKRKAEITEVRAPAPRSNSIIRWVIAASLVLSAIEAVWNWPNYLAYFNCLAGGASGGYKHLVDSSLDWGQDLKGLGKWLKSQPVETPPRTVYLSYFGTAVPEYYGISAVPLPGFFKHYEPHVPEPLGGGVYCISATLLEGIYLDFPGKWNQRYEKFYQQVRRSVSDYKNAADDPVALRQLTAGATQQQIDRTFDMYESLRFARLCAFLRQREPDANIGHTILIYRLSDADVAHALDDPPVELLPDCEPDAKECIGVK